MYPPADPWPKDEWRFGNIDVRSLYFVGKSIPVAGYHYFSCRFDGCTFEDGIVNMTNCKINNAAAIRAQTGGAG